ncbi:MAG: putative molybdenum carrier protein [Opitutales bacterium]
MANNAPWLGLQRIVSGGQTGVDQGALDAALETGFACGGWAPEGRLDENGIIDSKYPVNVLEGADYAERTRANVRDSDATLILCPGPPEGGTRLTHDYARRKAKPCLLLDANALKPLEAVGPILAFLARHRVSTLNVAGPRASGWPSAHAYAQESLRLTLTALASVQA